MRTLCTAGLVVAVGLLLSGDRHPTPVGLAVSLRPVQVANSAYPGITNERTEALGGDPVLVGAGDIGSISGDGDEATAKLLDAIFSGNPAGGIFTAGDNVNEDPVNLTDFTAYFDPTWGRHKALIRPGVGNHDYLDTAGVGQGYFDYFNGTGNFTGPAGDRDKGYYSYDLGAWHIIVINSNCSKVGGCGAGSPQEEWLRADLAAHATPCTAAIWHHPRFSSSEHGSSGSMQAIWQALYDYGAEVVFSGHNHVYERFAPQDATGKADPMGIREFVVGTGGKSHYSWISDPLANEEVRNNDTWGVIKLTLHPTSYDWQFIPVAGMTFTDSGSQSCHVTGSETPTPTQTATPTGTFTPTPTPTATPGTSVFSPVADAYVDGSRPTANYGTSTKLRLDASPIVRSYLRFNVTGLSGSVSKATLRVFANSASTVGYRVRGVANNSWGETTTTYNNAPAISPTVVGSSGPFSAGVWTTVDVTSLISGNGTFSMALTGTSTTAISLAGRESGAQAPQLVSEWSSPPVGGIAELPGVSDRTAPSYLPLAGLAAVALFALGAGACYSWRRWIR